MCYTFQTDDYKTVRWSSSETCFHLEIDTDFYSCIDYGFRYTVILYWNLLKSIPIINIKVILLDLKMFNYMVGYLFFCNNKKYIIIRNLFQKLGIFKTELTCSKIFLTS